MSLSNLTPIGVIHTPFERADGMPIQGNLSPETKGEVHVLPEYVEGLSDLSDFSHLILLYLFHRLHGFELKVKPFLDNRQRGLFSTRAPKRPNPIGLTVVGMDSIDGSVLHVRGVDMLDGTPLLDIKPYIREFDCIMEAENGWIRGKIMEGIRSDKRFTK